MGGHSASWADFDGQMTRWRAEWAKNGGAGLRILVGPTTSPTMFRQIAELRTALPQARVHLFDPIGTYDAAATIRLRPKSLDSPKSSSASTTICWGPGRRRRSTAAPGASGTGMRLRTGGCAC